MIRNKAILVFSISGLFLFLFLNKNFESQKTALFLSKKIPAPVISATFLKSNAVKYFVPKNNLYKVQYISFNHKRLDTVYAESNSWIDELSKQNYWMVNEMASYKQRAPINQFNEAGTMCARYVNTQTNEYGPWTYFTAIQKKPTMPVVSLLINPTSFFDFYKGIYTAGISQITIDSLAFKGSGWWLNPGNWLNKGKEWERPVTFQYLSQTGNIAFTSNAGVRINGNATRGFSQKSLRLLASKKYGNKVFEYDFFDGSNSAKYKSLILRNSGNDWGKTMFADAFIQSCVSDSVIDKQAYKSVLLYINGIYWGIYGLCERLDEDIIAQRYSIKKSKITILEGELLSAGEESDKQDYLKIVHTSKHINGKNEKWYDALCSEIDIHNFCTYTAIQLYIANTDLHAQNIKKFRIENSKWKWLLRDLDCSYSYSGNESFKLDMFETLMRSKSDLGIIFNACMHQPSFRKTLLLSMEYLLSNGFAINNQLAKLNAYKNLYEAEMPMQVARWRKPASLNDWNNSINAFENFIKNREKVVRLQMKKYLEAND